MGITLMVIGGMIIGIVLFSALVVLLCGGWHDEFQS